MYHSMTRTLIIAALGFVAISPLHAQSGLLKRKGTHPTDTTSNIADSVHASGAARTPVPATRDAAVAALPAMPTEAAVANGDAIADAARKVAAANAKAREELETPNSLKRGPLGHAMKMVAGRAGAAASAIEKKTGMDEGQLAEAAGAALNVGGAVAGKTPGVAMIGAMRRQQEKDREQARAALADREARSAAVFQMLAKGGIADQPAAATPTSAAGGGPALALPVAPNADKESADLLARLERVRQQGAAGDTVAAARAARAQLEINDAAATLATVPMRKQRQATKEALRAAVACAEGGHCRHDRR